MKRMIALLCVIFLVFLSSCGSSEVESSSTPDYERELVEETEYYKLFRDGFNYECEIYSKDKEVVKTENYPRQPRLSLIDNRIVEFSLQSGTGIYTRWTYYYDAEINEFSDVFTAVFDRYEELVVYADNEKVTVRHIFDKDTFFREIASFKYPKASTAEAIASVQFVDNGKAVKVNYLSGEDRTPVSEIFLLTE